MLNDVTLEYTVCYIVILNTHSSHFPLVWVGRSNAVIKRIMSYCYVLGSKLYKCRKSDKLL